MNKCKCNNYSQNPRLSTDFPNGENGCGEKRPAFYRSYMAIHRDTGMILTPTGYSTVQAVSNNVNKNEK